MDPPDHNAGMVDKLELPIPLLSDARGDLSRRCGLWNAEEGVAVPAIVVVDRAGDIRHAYSGDDFADRPGDNEIFEALDALDAGGEPGAREPEVVLSAGEAQAQSVRPEKPAMTLEQLIPYYRGVFFTTVALKKRFAGSRNREALDEVGGYQKLTTGYSEALNETRRLKKG